MLTPEQARDRAADIVARARAAGADAADAVFAADASLEVSVRLGALEDVGRSESEELGLRVFVGQRSASVSTSDLSGDAMTLAVERAVAMAREARIAGRASPRGTPAARRAADARPGRWRRSRARGVACRRAGGGGSRARRRGRDQLGGRARRSRASYRRWRPAMALRRAMPRPDTACRSAWSRAQAPTCSATMPITARACAASSKAPGDRDSCGRADGGPPQPRQTRQRRDAGRL